MATIHGTSESETLEGTNNNDGILGHYGNDVISGGDGNDIIYGDNGPSDNSGRGGNDIINGGAGNDTLYGDGGDDILNGGEGHDVLLGWTGNDTLINSTGNDTLSGQFGDDIYRIREGYGDALISNADLGNGYDVIEFDGAISPADITVSQSGNDLLLTINATNEVITVSRHFSNQFNSAIEEVKFSDGTSWTTSTIENIITAQNEPREDNVLGGGSSDDTYLINIGDGNTFITGEYDGVENEMDNDRIVFGEGISPQDLTFVREGVDLVATIGVTGETVTVPRHFETRYFDDYERGRLWQVEAFEFSNGTRIDMNNIVYANSAATDGADTISFNNSGDSIEALAGDDDIRGGRGDDYIDGGDDDDIIYGEGGNDILITGHGNDTVYGGNGDDMILITSKEDDHDTAVGGAGSDTYFYGQGSGDVTITESIYFDGSDADRLIFDEGIDPSDVLVSRDGRNLLLTIQSTGAVITVTDAYISGQYFNKLESVFFSDGTEWDRNTVRSMTVGATDGNDVITADEFVGTATRQPLSGLGGNDTIYGNDARNRLLGGEGDDTIYGGAGNDTLQGESGDDQLEGGSGDDFLYGGEGNDALIGWVGDDTYFYNQGDGSDTIIEYREVTETASNKGTDTIRFGENISSSDISLSRSAASFDLLVTVESTGEVITVNDFFLSTTTDGSYRGRRSQIEGIEFNDGTSWDLPTIMSNVHNPEGTAANDVITLDDSGSFSEGYDGNDNILGGRGNDIIDGGNGDDIIYGEQGNDFIMAGNGNDVIYGGGGDDLIVLESDGTDTDIVSGGLGNDLIAYSQSSGDVTIKHEGLLNGFENSLFFDENISVDDVSVSENNDDILLTIESTGKVITIDSFNSFRESDSLAVQKVSFADGTSWYTSDLLSMASTADTSTESNALNNQVDQLVSAMGAFDAPSGAGSIVLQDDTSQLQPLLVEPSQAA